MSTIDKDCDTSKLMGMMHAMRDSFNNEEILKYCLELIEERNKLVSSGVCEGDRKLEGYDVSIRAALKTLGIPDDLL